VSTTSPKEDSNNNKPKEDEFVPLPEGDPELIALALKPYHVLKYRVFAHDEHKDRHLTSKFYRRKMRYDEWRKVQSDYAISQEVDQGDDGGSKVVDRGAPYKTLAPLVLDLKMTPPISYNDFVDKAQVNKIIDALVFRARTGLPQISTNIRNLIFAGKAQLTAEEEECYTMFMMLKEFTIRPWELQNGVVYIEDISAINTMIKLFTQRNERRAQKLQEDKKREEDERNQAMEQYMKGLGAGPKYALPPLNDPSTTTTTTNTKKITFGASNNSGEAMK